MNKYIIIYGDYEHEGFDGFQLQSTKPIPAESEEAAADLFRDIFESQEGRECEIHSIKLIKD